MMKTGMKTIRRMVSWLAVVNTADRYPSAPVVLLLTPLAEESSRRRSASSRIHPISNRRSRSACRAVRIYRLLPQSRQHSLSEGQRSIRRSTSCPRTTLRLISTARVTPVTGVKSSVMVGSRLILYPLLDDERHRHVRLAAGLHWRSRRKLRGHHLRERDVRRNQLNHHQQS